MWWAKVRENTDHEIAVDLKPFSLVQVNHDNNNDDGFKFWEQDDSDNTLLELRAGISARAPGPGESSTNSLSTCSGPGTRTAST